MYSSKQKTREETRLFSISVFFLLVPSKLHFVVTTCLIKDFLPRSKLWRNHYGLLQNDWNHRGTTKCMDLHRFLMILRNFPKHNNPKESQRYSRTSFQRGTPLNCQKKAWKEDSYEEKVIKNFLLFKTKNMRRNKTVFN